ncbi:MAG TPA: peptidylprolyl isomerase, partial [Bacteroidia bacterium]|nr:peptidylprolyl isomerase [Bacteroidia bacterium]
MLKKAFFILFLALGFNLSAQQVIDKVIAVVGKYPLLLSDFETYQIEKQKEDPNSPRCKAFEEILYSKLLLAQADRDSVEVQDAEVEQELEKRLAYYIQMFGGDESKFEAFYGKRTNVFKDEMRDDVRDQLLAQKMRQRITGEIKLTPSEVRQYYNSLSQDSFPVINTELQIAHIVKMPPVNEQAKADARAAIESYRERVLKGESMSVLAALYSEDPGSAKNGGRYESVMRGVMVPEFEAVAFRLKKGEISEVIETP